MPATYKEPDEFNFDIESFASNPLYQYTQDQGRKQTLAGLGNAGARQSGAALKALYDRGAKTAYEFYAPERDAAYSRHTNDRNFLRSNFESDRGYEYQQGRDQRADSVNDRDFAYGQTRDARGDSEWDQTFGYTKERDAVGDARDTRNFDYGVGRDAVGDARDARDFDYGVTRDGVADARDARDFDYGAGRDARTDYQWDTTFDYGASRDARGDYVDDRTFDYTSATDARDFEYGAGRDLRRDFETDRNYLTSRYDRETDDWFKLTDTGQGATDTISRAEYSHGDDLAGSYRNDGETRATAGIVNSDIWTSAANDVAGAYSSYLNRKK